MRMYSSRSCESPAKVSSISSWFLRENNFCGSPGPWKSIQYPPSFERNESGAGDEFTKALDGFEIPTTRDIKSVPSSHVGNPEDSNSLSILEVSLKRKTASTLQVSEWPPTASFPHLAPESIASAPSSTLFPAPVSPVTAVKPSVKSISARSSSARFSILKYSIILGYFCHIRANFPSRFFTFLVYFSKTFILPPQRRHF